MELDPVWKKMQAQGSTALSSGTVVPGGGYSTWTEGFLNSAWDSIPELIGISPSPETVAWRAEHPWASLGSQLAGMAVPYVGWEATAAKLPVLGSALARIGSAEKMLANPIRTTVQTEVAKLVPFEAGRLAAAAAFGDPENFGEVATSAVLDLGLAGGVGAVVGAIRGTRVPKIDRSAAEIAKMFPDYDPTRSRQEQLRVLRDIETARVAQLGAAADSDSMTMALRGMTAKLDREIRLELPKPPRGTSREDARVVQPLVSGNGQLINRLFHLESPLSTAHKSTIYLSDSAGNLGFTQPGMADETLKAFGLSRDHIPYMQYPRLTFFKSAKRAGEVEHTIQSNMTPVGSGWFLAKEQPTGTSQGLYVLAKKLEGEGPGAVPGTIVKDPKLDRWLLTKTDKPSKFIPQGGKWADLMTSRSDWEASYLGGLDMKWALDNLDIYSAQETFMKEMPFEVARNLRRGKPEDFFAWATQKMGLKPGTEIVGETAAKLHALAKEFTSPTLYQFSGHPMARWLYGVARHTFDYAQQRAQEIMFGDIKLAGQGTGNLLKVVLGRPSTVGGIKQALDPLTDGDLRQLWTAWTQHWAPDVAKKNMPELSERAFNAMKVLDKWDREQLEQMIKTQRFAGIPEFVPTSGHYMIARTWAGAYRQRIIDEAGNIVYVASGNKQQTALTSKRILEEAKKQGQKWALHPSDLTPKLSDRWTDLKILKDLRIASPSHKIAAEIAIRLPPLPRKSGGWIRNVGGYVGSEAPWSKKELTDIVRDHVFQRQRYIAELSVHHRLGQEMFNLGTQDSSLYLQLLDRIRDLTGRPGPLSRYQNQLVDRFLAPVLGPNSATKIVTTTNNLMMNLQLGMLNLSFPLLNAMTFMQTVLPHTAFVLTADPAKLQRYYTMFGVAGQKGMRGSLGVVDPLKILARTFREIRKPDAELAEAFRQATKEGITDPRLVEDYIGEQATSVLALGKVVKGEEPFVNWLKAVSEFLPAQSEKFARAQSFVQGWIIARDFANLTGKARYQFAKEFTNHTMYLYSTADRARIITGPVGTLFGMFKNWQMHYIANMMQYTGEAFKKGNFAPLLWMAGGTAALGGVGALPLYTLADSMSKVLTDQSLMLNLYQMFGMGEDETQLADGLFYGLPGFMGLSLQGQATAPGQDFAKDASLLFSFVQWDRAKYLGQTFGEAYDHWTATGESPLKSPQVRDLLIRAVGPKTLYRLTQTMNDGAIRSLSTGYPVVNNTSLLQRIAYSFALTPIEIDKTYAAMDELWRKQDLRRATIQELGESWAAAHARGDQEAQQNVLIQAQAKGVDMSSVLRSGHARAFKHDTPVIERQFKGRDVEPYYSSGIAQRGGLQVP